MTLNSMTVLHAPGRQLCKTVRQDCTVPYDRSRTFFAEEVKVENIYDVHTLMGILSPAPAACVVRGTPFEKKHQDAAVNARRSNHWRCSNYF